MDGAGIDGGVRIASEMLWGADRWLSAAVVKKQTLRTHSPRWMTFCASDTKKLATRECVCPHISV